MQRDYEAPSSQIQILSGKPVHLRNFWVSLAAKQFPMLSVAARQLLTLHVTTAAAERNWSAWGRLYTALRNQLGLEKAEKMVFIKANMPDADSDDE
jgi:hypothetical protein